jgi:hypothetical protein
MAMTAELAQSLWDYNAETGVLRWKVSPRYGVHVGDVTGCPNRDGHLQVRYKGKAYQVHRLIWIITTGNWPIEELDHINGVRDDNRLVNLREATRRQNCRNKTCHRVGQLRFTTYAKSKGKWMAQPPRINGKQKTLGYYDTMQEASEAAERWVLDNHPELA